MLFWIVLGASAVILFGIALFRVRRGWTGEGGRTSWQDAHPEAYTSSWLSRISRGRAP